MKRTTVRMEKQLRTEQQQKAREAIFTGIMAVDPPKFYPTAEHIDDDPNWYTINIIFNLIFSLGLSVVL